MRQKRVSAVESVSAARVSASFMLSEWASVTSVSSGKDTMASAACSIDPKAVRASMGAMFRLRIKVYDRVDEYRESYPERKLYPFMLDASVPLQEAVKDKAEVWTLVFGNEGRGLPKEFSTYGQAVRIESNDKVDSLNLAMAAGIAIYEFIIP